MAMEPIERYRGALFGLAVGDAVGASVASLRPGTFPPVTDMTGGGPHQLSAGEWTGNTSIALCLAESLLESGSFNPLDQMRRYGRWYRDGYLSSTGRCLAVGNVTREAVEKFERTGEPLCGSVDPRTAGNGSLVRVAPIALYFASDPQVAIAKCGESSRTTHGARAAIDACRYFGGLIVGAIHNATKRDLVSARFTPANARWYNAPLTRSIDEVAAGSFRRAEPPEVAGTAYVVQSLEAALWAFHRSSSFSEGLLKAVNLGDDANTTAAIYGQLAGAHYGYEAIPVAWRSKIAGAELIEGFAQRLHVASEQRPEAVPVRTSRTSTLRATLKPISI